MDGMKILSLEADNVKRLRAVRLELNGENMVVVGAPDGGKTTAIDLVWKAFSGRAVGPEVITHGEDAAQIKVVIGNPQRTFTITRKFSKSGEPTGRLTVKSSDGGTFGAKFLDELISGLTFDPTEFANAEGKAQVDMLLQVVKLPDGVSLEGMEKERKATYDKRTEFNKDADRIKAKLPADEPELVEEVKLVDLLAGLEVEIEKAKKTNVQNAADRKMYSESQAKMDSAQENVEKLQKELLIAESALTDWFKAVTEMEPKVLALVDVDEAPLLARRGTIVEEAEKTNTKARARKEWEKQKAELEEVKNTADYLTNKLHELDEQKKTILENVPWPVTGLGIREGNVTLNDTILSQCGTSVRMRVSCAIAMAMNPKLNTIRIDEGESLGAEGRQEIFQWAHERGFQVLMSIVKDSAAAPGELEIVEDMLSNVG